MRRLLSILFLLVLVVSCNKPLVRDRLRHEAEVLVGDWNWVYSDDYSYGDPIFPGDTTLMEASLKFEKKGVVTFYEDFQETQKENIHITNYYTYNGFSDFFLVLGNGYDQFMNVNVNAGDTMQIYTWPLNGLSNYFVRK